MRQYDTSVIYLRGNPFTFRVRPRFIDEDKETKRKYVAKSRAHFTFSHRATHAFHFRNIVIDPIL